MTTSWKSVERIPPRPPDSKMSLRRFVTRAAIHSLALVSLSGCSITNQTIDLTHVGPAETILVYEGDSPSAQRVIVAGSAEDRSIQAWLHSHREGWQPSLATYVPAKYVRGKNFSLNFHDEMSILNICENGKNHWRQLTRTNEKDDPIPDAFALEQPAR
jgi:hypothetical protein